MSFSALLLSATLAQFAASGATSFGPGYGNTNEDIVQACIRNCYAFIDKPGYELKACISQCQELAKP
jgi:hypothetical protein